MRPLIWIGLILAVAGCGKNEAVRPIPLSPPPVSNPPTQAPPPGGGGYNPGYYPGGNGGYNPGYFPGGPGGYNPGYPPGFRPPGMLPPFRPELPPGMPPQYYPFLPVDNYFRCQPQMAPYWDQVWTQWEGYAADTGCSPYDFNTFWFEYCPQIWSGSSMENVYQSIDVNFYGWVDPYSTQFSSYADPGYFWDNYDGMSY